MKAILNKLAIKSEYSLVLKRNPDFNKLFFAAVLSMIGTQMHRFALPWIVYDISGSATLMAVNFTISLVPGFFFGLIGGILSDRYSRKKVLIISDLLASFFTILIVFLHFGPIELKVWHLFVLTFILSSINSVYLPSFRAGMPSLVVKDDVITANGLFSVAQSFVSLGGPILAGMMIGFVGPWTNIAVNSVSFLLSAIIIMIIKNNELSQVQDQKKKSTFFSDLYEGFDVIKRTKWLLCGIFLIFGIYLGTGSVGSLIQYYLRNELHIDGMLFGISFALFEFIPMLVAGYYAPLLGKKFKMESVVLSGAFMYALSLIGMGITTIYPIVIFSGMILNASSVFIVVNWNTMIQQQIPNHILGRVSGTVLTVQSVALLSGGAISSFLITLISAQWVLIGFGLITGLFAVITLNLPFAHLKSSNVKL
ncbi:MFS transporter [Brevibacillus laterosporus]|uniref:MFS transporter n=1 Tax=Brevibacillus laterosporus TaxID=1465 RepID=UPI0035A68E6D